VHVRLAQAGAGDFHELSARAHRLDVLAAAVAHARAHSAHQLLDHPHDRALVRHAPLDALGHELVGVNRRILEIAVGRALLHRRQRTHAPVRLVRAPLEQLDLARRLLGAGEQAPQHHRVRARGDRFGDVAREAHPAVRDQRYAAFLERARDVLDRGDLGNAHPGDDARGADRSRPDADLHRVGSGVDQRLGAVGRGDVSADHLRAARVLLDPAQPVDHAL
jgi:hypothetical protein